MNNKSRIRLRTFCVMTWLLPFALTPGTALAQDAAPQNDAGAALGNLFKSFVQAAQRAGGNAGKEQAQAAPQGAQSPVVSQPVTPPSAALDYYIAIYKNNDAAEIRNYVSKITSPTKVLKWADTNDFIVALGPYDSEATVKRVIDLLSSKSAELNASTLPVFVFRKGTPDGQLVTSQSAQNALRPSGKDIAKSDNARDSMREEILIKKSEMIPCNENSNPNVRCKGFIDLGGGNSWDGEILNGQGDGFGTYQFGPNDKYPGQFPYKYVGQFVHGVRQGKGTQYQSDGSVWSGDFYNDSPNGKIEFSNKSGTKYIGFVKDWDFDGYGEYTFPDGSKYTGIFRRNDFLGPEYGSIPNAKPFYIASYKISKPFGYMGGEEGNKFPHSGIDFLVPSGSLIYATDDGIVGYADNFANQGLTVTVLHGANTKSQYSFLSNLNVKIHQKVRKGELIGSVSSKSGGNLSNFHYGLSIDGIWTTPLEHFNNKNIPDKASEGYQNFANWEITPENLMICAEYFELFASTMGETASGAHWNMRMALLNYAVDLYGHDQEEIFRHKIWGGQLKDARNNIQIINMTDSCMKFGRRFNIF